MDANLLVSTDSNCSKNSQFSISSNDDLSLQNCSSYCQLCSVLSCEHKNKFQKRSIHQIIENNSKNEQSNTSYFSNNSFEIDSSSNLDTESVEYNNYLKFKKQKHDRYVKFSKLFCNFNFLNFLMFFRWRKF